MFNMPAYPPALKKSLTHLIDSPRSDTSSDVRRGIVQSLPRRSAAISAGLYFGCVRLEVLLLVSGVLAASDCAQCQEMTVIIRKDLG